MCAWLNDFGVSPNIYFLVISLYLVSIHVFISSHGNRIEFSYRNFHLSLLTCTNTLAISLYRAWSDSFFVWINLHFPHVRDSTESNNNKNGLSHIKYTFTQSHLLFRMPKGEWEWEYKGDRATTIAAAAVVTYARWKYNMNHILYRVTLLRKSNESFIC